MSRFCDANSKPSRAWSTVKSTALSDHASLLANSSPRSTAAPSDSVTVASTTLTVFFIGENDTTFPVRAQAV